MIRRVGFRGVCLTDVWCASDAAYSTSRHLWTAVLLVPSNAAVRAYLVYPHDALIAAGTADASRFIDEIRTASVVPAEFYVGAACRPLASFDGADNWVDHPYRTESRSSETPPVQ